MGLVKVVVFLLVFSSIVGTADTLGIKEPVSSVVGTSGCCVAVSVGLLVCLRAAVRCGGRGRP